MSETELMKEIQVEASKRGARLFRNNVGLWELADGRKIRTGLCVGSADLIGWTREGRFLAVEIKTGRNPLRIEQRKFLDAVNASGGVGIEARGIEDLIF